MKSVAKALQGGRESRVMFEPSLAADPLQDTRAQLSQVLGAIHTLQKTALRQPIAPPQSPGGDHHK